MWTLAIFSYGIASLMEFLMNPDLLNFNGILFNTFYFNSSLLVGLLGAGQLYLITQHKISAIFLGFIITLSIGLIISLSLTPFPTGLSFLGELGKDIRIISDAYPYSVRIYAILLASVGGTMLLFGSLYSFIRDRTRYYTLFFALGALMPMLRNIPFGYLGNELIGLIFLFLGFLLSMFHLKSQKIQESSIPS
ncbi:MAG: hypothetical protein ACFFBW_04305 [Promethearchaeota archaeon]